MMKTKRFGIIVLIAILLVSLQFPNKALGTNPDIIYRSIRIDLRDFYDNNKLHDLCENLFNAAAKGRIKAYRDDSLKSFYSNEEFLYPYMCKDYEKVIPDQNKIKNGKSYTICFNPWYDQERNIYQFDLTGFGLDIYLKVDEEIIGPIEMCYFSKDDIIKQLGQKGITELFAKCYKAMLKSINTDKQVSQKDNTSLNIDLGKYLGEFTLDEMNEKMYFAVTDSLPNSGKHISAYKTSDLNTTYTIQEVLKRGYSMEVVQMADPNDPNSEKLIDTSIKDRFRIEGNKLYSLSLKWSYDTKTTSATADISGYGLYVPLENNDGSSYKGTLFWLDWKDIKVIYTAMDMTILKYTFYNVFINRQDSDISFIESDVIKKKIIKNFTLPHLKIYSFNNFSEYRGIYHWSPLKDSIYKAMLTDHHSYLEDSSIEGIPVTMIVKSEIKGNKEVIIYTDSQYDDFVWGEEGYWIAFRQDTVWTEYYTGLTENNPLILKWDSKLPLIKDDKTISIEAALIRQTKPTILPGGGPEYELVKDGLVVEFMMDSLKKDSDKDGLTDIAERKMMLNPYSTDTDNDGINDLNDMNPRFKSMQTENSIIYEYILGEMGSKDDSLIETKDSFVQLPQFSKREISYSKTEKPNYLIITDDKDLQGISPLNQRLIIMSTKDCENYYCKKYPNSMSEYGISPLSKIEGQKDTYKLIKSNGISGDVYLIKKTKKGWQIKNIDGWII